jgi:hypothetical protein
MGTDMVKLIYLARRMPDLTRERFVARWRKHGGLAMSQQLWRHMEAYVQASVLQPAPITGASADYDAVGVLWFKGDSHLKSPTAADTADVAEMAEDEFHTFSEPVQPRSLVGDEEVVNEGGHGRTTAYLFFKDPGQAQQAAKHVAESATSIRVTLTKAWPSSAARLPYEAVVSLSGYGVGDIRGALGEPGLAATGADLTVVANDAVLWEDIDAVLK